MALLLVSGFALHAAPDLIVAPAESRIPFTNSVGPLPPEALPSVRDLDKSNLGESMEIEVPLKMRNLPELRKRIERGERVPAAELEKNYLPSAEDYATVRAWLAKEGYTITVDDPNRLAIFARHTLAGLQQSLGVEMVKVTVKGNDYSSARTNPSLPKEVAGLVLGVNGLQPFLEPRRHILAPNPNASSGQSYLSVSQVVNAYSGANLGLDGTGQTIAILIDSVPLQSDLTSFWNWQNIPQSFSNIQEVAVTGSLPQDTEGEATLDVEWSSSIATGAKIRVYCTGDLTFTDIDKGLQRFINDMPSQPNMHELSISLGLGETYLQGSSEMQTESQYFATIAAGGVSVFVASGDAGSNPNSSGGTNGPLQVEYESSDPSVTGVGGTNLVLNSNGTVASETGWSGSGGGNSVQFSRPTWQTGTGVPSGTMRCVPDVCSVASTTTAGDFEFDGQQTGVAGTSWATPTWAAFAALINQARINNSLQPLGPLNPLIYPLIGTSNFRDITSGSNGKYSCGTGYDRVTGIGSPMVSTLLATLSGSSSSAPSIQSFTPTSGPPGQVVTITGANFKSVSSVTFNGVSAASFTVVSASQITATVPSSATTGPIAVATSNASAKSSTSFTVTLAIPANDNFASAQSITGNSGSLAGSNVNATRESGEPEIDNNPGGASVWYSWKAPQTAVYTFSTAGSSFATLLGVYTGTSVNALTLVASSDGSGTGGATAVVSFAATAGTTYDITVDGYNGGSAAQTGAFDLAWSENTSAPLIVSFSPQTGGTGTTVVINGASFTGATGVSFGGVAAASFNAVSSTQMSATVSAGAVTGPITVTTPNGTAQSQAVFTVVNPPANDNFASAARLSGASGTATGTNVGASLETGEPEIAGNPGGHSVWYTWTAPANGNVTFNTFGSSFDTLLAAYTGSAVNALTLVAGDQNVGGGINSMIAFNVTSGTTYYIQVDGANGLVGNIVLNWLSNVAAPTISGFSPDTGGFGATVTITGGSFSSVSQVTFNGAPATYNIQSDQQIFAQVPTGATTGPLSVQNISGTAATADNFTVISAPGNDDFASAYTFTGTGAVTGTNVGATLESGEPVINSNAGGHSVWWTWTAPTTAPYNISTLGSDFATLLGVYTGSSVSGLNAVATDQNDPNGGTSSFAPISAVSGTQYYIKVDGVNGATGHISLSITLSGTSTLFSTGFETSQGYTTSLALSGQNGWVSSGSGANGIVSNFFPGMGQQAYIGNNLPRGGGAHTFVWQPINYVPQAGDKITFQVAMQIVDSTRPRYDAFAWSVYDQAGNELFALLFDNLSLEVFYELNDGSNTDTGFAFNNQTIYSLTMTMDFANNVWSASLNGTAIVSNQMISTSSTTSVPRDLGDIDATWLIEQNGNNYLLFDNYSIQKSNGAAPQILIQPQPQTATAGTSAEFSVTPSGTEPFTFQWQRNGTNLQGTTNAVLTLTNVQPSDAGNYSVVVTNGAGSISSNSALLTVTVPQLPNLTPFTPPGWSDSIVVSSTSGSITDDSLILSSENLYIDWAITNTGPVSTPAGFQNSLYVDGVLKNVWTVPTALAPTGNDPNDNYSITGYSIGTLSPGSHTIEIVADSANQVAEFDEADNSYTKSITVTNGSGYYQVNATAAPSDSGTVTGSGQYRGASTATVTATANSGYQFVAWTKGAKVVSQSPSYSFTVTSDESLAANFAPSVSGDAPAIDISAPTSETTFSTVVRSIRVSGTASSNAKHVTWADNHGHKGMASGTTLWSIGSLPLQVGQNIITVTAHTSESLTAGAALTINVSLAANFAGSYAGPITTSESPANYLGMGAFTVSGAGSYTGALCVQGVRHAISGSIAADGTISGKAGNAGRYSLALSPGTGPTIAGTIDTGTTTLALSAQRGSYHAAKKPFIGAGSYTFVIQPDTAVTASPQGVGIGRVTITAGGVVTVDARLADGTTFSEGTILSGAVAPPLNLGNSFPLYGATYHGQGYLAGQLAIGIATPVLSGAADWLVSANASPSRFTAGFQAALSISGDLFHPGAAANPVLAAGSRALTLSGANLSSDIQKTAAFLAPNHFTISPSAADKLTLTVSPSTGLITGTFVDPATGKTTSIYGVTLETEDSAAGFFLGGSSSGLLELDVP